MRSRSVVLGQLILARRPRSISSASRPRSNNSSITDSTTKRTSCSLARWDPSQDAYRSIQDSTQAEAYMRAGSSGVNWEADSEEGDGSYSSYSWKTM
jgi:hypothetical protein